MHRQHDDDPGFGYVIWFRGNIHVTDAAGETRAAADWVGKSGRKRKLRAAQVTASHACEVGAAICVHAEAIKEAWCLAVSNAGGFDRHAGEPLYQTLDYRAKFP